jgi:hypothetical protein
VAWDFRAVLEAADRAVAGLQQMEARAETDDERQWASRRRRAAETEAAALYAASGRGLLAGYEAAGRALAAERVPLEDAPPLLAHPAEDAIRRLDRFAAAYRATLSTEPPAPDAVSNELRAASRARARRSLEAVATVRVQRPAQRAAATGSPTPVRVAGTSSGGPQRLEAQQGERHLEIWVVDPDLHGPPLAPITLRRNGEPEQLYALLTAVLEPSRRLGYLRVPSEASSTEIEMAAPLGFEQLQPSDAGALLDSVGASGRSWRERWQDAAQPLPWLATLLADAPEAHERD